MHFCKLVAEIKAEFGSHINIIEKNYLLVKKLNGLPLNFLHVQRIYD